METNIDFGKNIKESLVTEKVTATNKETKVADYLLARGFDATILSSLPEEVTESIVSSGNTTSFIDVSDNCVKINFEVIEDISVKGKVCANGTADLDLNAYGFSVEILDAKIGENGICNTTKVSGFLTVKACFKLKDNCLYTTGKITTPFGTLGTWDERVVCL